MTEPVKQGLSWVLRFSVLIAVAFVSLGALLYLLQEGQAPVSESHFSQLSAAYTTILPILQDALHLKAFALILLGFLVLVFSQILRVLVLGVYFLKNTEYWLAASSFFVLCVLLYSLF